MKTITPNTVLPKGGKLVKPFRKKIGGWLAMEFDADVYVCGVRWLRVKGGFGGEGGREDWVAVIPVMSASVSDYQFREPRWGFKSYPSFETACEHELREAVLSLQNRIKETTGKLAEQKKALRSLAYLLK